MALEGVSGPVSIPLMEKAIAGSKRLVKQSSGMSDIELDAHIRKGRAESMTKAKETLRANEEQKKIVARVSGQDGKAPSVNRFLSRSGLSVIA